jgi:large subunit ribosomal protein L4
MEFNVKTLEGKDAGKVSLSDAIFGLEPREDILARVIRWQLPRSSRARTRQGPRRSMAHRCKKMYKQKGTGRARHHSARAPQFRGGGKAHGPVVRSHEHDLPKKVRALACVCALGQAKGSEMSSSSMNLVAAEQRPRHWLGHFETLGLTNALFIGGAELDGNFKLAARTSRISMFCRSRASTFMTSCVAASSCFPRLAVEALEERFK